MPGFSPCGAIVGMLGGQTYTAPCRWYDGGPVGRIRYYRVPPTNKYLQGDTAFYPRFEDYSTFRNVDGTGEVVGRTARSPPTNFHPELDGSHPFGSADDFAGRSPCPAVQPPPPECAADRGTANVIRFRAGVHQAAGPMFPWTVQVQFQCEGAIVV